VAAAEVRCFPSQHTEIIILGHQRSHTALFFSQRTKTEFPFMWGNTIHTFAFLPLGMQSSASQDWGVLAVETKIHDNIINIC